MARLQTAFYDAIIEGWPHFSNASREESVKSDVRVKLRNNFVHLFHGPHVRARGAVDNWIRSVKVMGGMLLPRVTVSVIKAGLHGWATNHRCGRESRRCILCNRYNDTLDHMSSCSVTRELWRRVLPG